MGFTLPGEDEPGALNLKRLATPSETTGSTLLIFPLAHDERRSVLLRVFSARFSVMTRTSRRCVQLLETYFHYLHEKRVSGFCHEPGYFVYRIRGAY